jgi:hypothetical protein
MKSPRFSKSLGWALLAIASAFGALFATSSYINSGNWLHLVVVAALALIFIRATKNFSK